MFKPEWSLSRLSMNVDRRDDVPLMAATLLWDDGYRPTDCGCTGWHRDCPDASEPVRLAPVVLDASREDFRAERWDNATGACFFGWTAETDDERLVKILRDAWMAVLRDGVDASAMHVALLAVPEFRALIHPDELPAIYRDE